MSGYVAANDRLYAECDKRILPRTSLIQPVTNGGTRGLGGYLAFGGQPYYRYYRTIEFRGQSLIITVSVADQKKLIGTAYTG